MATRFVIVPTKVYSSGQPAVSPDGCGRPPAKTAACSSFRQVLVTQNSKLRMPFVNLGLCPEFGASLLLPRLLGHARTARMLLWGESLDGGAAVACGLANEVFDDAEKCLTAAQYLARRLLALPRQSLLRRENC
ncbi:enoyl-CoA hydratase-related protein [Pseudomonas sp. HLT2-19-2]